MIQLQNNYTTPEQSTRLLALGLPADSADCYYSRMKFDELYENPKILYNKYSDVARFHPKTFIYLPCWSVGRLIEICNICAGIGRIDFDTIAYLQVEWSESLVRVIRDLVKYDLMDFSKLED